MTAATEAGLAASIPALWDQVASRIAAGDRLADLFGTARGPALLLTAQVAEPGGVASLEALLPAGQRSYPALTPQVGSAFWYEREIHDLFGVEPAGHPRLEPLILPTAAGTRLPRPGSPSGPAAIDPDPGVLPRHTVGPGLFTIPHGPVRSGVTESIEYLVETPGEDIPHLNMRLFYKHRGIEKRFENLSPTDGVLLAERTEGVASVAHAVAFCQAVERIAGVEAPWRAALIRTLHAELERLACHLDVIVRLADGAGLAVATARFGWHKERILRLTGQLSGSRFGRGVVVPGGVAGPPALDPQAMLAAISDLDRAIAPDVSLLMGTASFLDRLRRTGPLPVPRATGHGAIGPIGRASGVADDDRQARPYAAYQSLGMTVSTRADGDALARLEVRTDEIRVSLHLLRQAADELAEEGSGRLRTDCAAGDGRAIGWAEAPQGELLYDVRIEDGRITRCRVRTAAQHNLVLMHEVFAGDILTDFPFIEASFGLPVAGAAR
jgi:formate hydrogenlyase subunit 5